MNLYAVMQQNFQYNDENYYVGEGDAGRVTKLYRDKKKAEKICLEKNISYFGDGTFSSFGDDISDILKPGWEKVFLRDEDEVKTAEVLEEDSPDADFIMNMQVEDIPAFLEKYPEIISYLVNPPYYVQKLEVDG